jgi:TonB family protein
MQSSLRARGASRPSGPETAVIAPRESARRWLPRLLRRLGAKPSQKTIPAREGNPVIAAVVLVAAGARLAAQDSLSIAKDLYVSAAYEDAPSTLKTRGMVDITIDETGRVVDASIRQSLTSSFDTLIVRTARTWKYRAAMKDGVAVRYQKTLVLVP